MSKVIRISDRAEKIIIEIEEYFLLDDEIRVKDFQIIEMALNQYLKEKKKARKKASINKRQRPINYND